METTEAQKQLNLASIQQRDPYITGIVDSAMSVCLYQYVEDTNGWKSTRTAGSIFVYTRRCNPTNGFIILNRHGRNDKMEPITSNLEFKLEEPFLLYRRINSEEEYDGSDANIYGIWFYDGNECARIGQLLNSLKQVAEEVEQRGGGGSEGGGGDAAVIRGRRASESDSLVSTGGGGAGATGGMAGAGAQATSSKNVDIMQMLSQAHIEYDKGKNKADGKPAGSEPKPLIDNPAASATKSSILTKPLALKMGQDYDDSGISMSSSMSANTPISLDTLFRGISTHNHAGGSHPCGPPPPLLALSGATVEEIERQQRSADRDDMPKPAGEESPASAIPNLSGSAAALFGGMGGVVGGMGGMGGMGGAMGGMGGVGGATGGSSTDNEPESPNTILRRTLKIGGGAIPRGGGGDGAKTPNKAQSQQQKSQQRHLPQRQHSVPAGSGMGPSPGIASPVPSTPPLPNFPSGMLLTQGLPPLPMNLAGTIPASSLENNTPASPGLLMKPEDFMKAGGAGGASARAATPEDMNISNSSGLITPADLLKSSKPQSQMPADMLLPPQLFHNTSATGKQSPVVSGASMSPSAEITPLTRTQLQQSLIHLLKNDTSFLTSIHEAYCQSLNSELHNKLDRL